MNGHLVTDLVAAAAIVMSVLNLVRLRRAEAELAALEVRILALIERYGRSAASRRLDYPVFDLPARAERPIP
jgi:hypothetical protein